MKLNGRNIFVSGGSNGIGRALVEGFIKEGANVFFTRCSDASSAERLRARLPLQSTVSGLAKQRGV